LCGNRQKYCASPEVRGAGIFGCWGFCLAWAARNKQAKPNLWLLKLCIDTVYKTAPAGDRKPV